MKPGRETMQMRKEKKLAGRIRQAGLVSVLLMLLCGCTKRDELLLLDEINTAEISGGQSCFPDEDGSQAVLEGEDLGGNRQIAGDGNLSPDRPLEGGTERVDAAAIQPGVIYVHVCGAVEQPGVYELEPGCRVYEAVQAAGGFAEDAEQNYVNQAQALDDGVKLVIPTQEEATAVEERETVSPAGTTQDGASEKNGIGQAGREKEIGIVGGTSPDGKSGEEGGGTGAAAASGGRININTASEAELCEIPGVGATRAAAIAAYRESHGAFGKPEDIMNVNGIKEGMYEKIKDSISVK